MSYRIVCRARVSADCYHGKPTRTQFGDDLPMDEDGTYDGSSLICDSCYVRLMPLTASGRGLNSELDAAIEESRRLHGTA